MKILLVGASGTLGRAIAETLKHHDILAAGRSSADYPVDITDDASVEALFAKTGKLDAIVSAAGVLHFGPLESMRPADFSVGLNDKLLGQVRLALLGQHHLNDGGSITLTTGIVSEEPIRAGANASAVNRAIEGFVQGAALAAVTGTKPGKNAP